MKPTRVFIVDDHPLMRNALEMAIESAYDMQVVGEAANGKEALRLIPLVEPDIVLMDLMMPEMGGIEAIRALVVSRPEMRILVLSSLDKENEIVRAVQSGALGYVTKNAQRDELLRAIRTVIAGEAYMGPEIAAKLIGTVGQMRPEGRGTRSITIRQKDVLEMLAQGNSNRLFRNSRGRSRNGFKLLKTAIPFKIKVETLKHCFRAQNTVTSPFDGFDFVV